MFRNPFWSVALVFTLAACGSSDKDSTADTDTNDSDTPASLTRDEICQIPVDCQFNSDVKQCNTMYFTSCTSKKWDEQAAVDCINAGCVPDYTGDSQTCAAFLQCLESCVYDKVGCI